MALVPATYNLRSLFVRKAITLLTVVSIGATVAVFAGMLALERGFRAMFTGSGRDDVAVLTRPGSTSEGDSIFARDRGDYLIKSLPEIAEGPDGRPLAAAELWLAVRRFKIDGGEVNVPLRGVQPKSLEIHGDVLRIVEGRAFTPGSDELIVGRPLTHRIRECRLDDTLWLNGTPFRVVGVFESTGPFATEIWGDLERFSDVLERPIYNRVVARLRPDVDIAALSRRLESDKQAPAKVATEREFLAGQTEVMSEVMIVIGSILAAVMGVAAVFTGTNSMLAALAARTHEIGVLLSIGFRPGAIFMSFLLESMLLGLLGGIAGCLMALPLNGIRTGTMNWQTFTEVAFAFRITPSVLIPAVGFALLLGLLGGAWPAWRAARLQPTSALRRV